MVMACNYFNVPLPLAYSVAIHESQGKEGPLGKSGFFQGPMGIPITFKKERGWPVDDPTMNVIIGVRALHWHLQGRTVKAALHRYNVECKKNGCRYCRAVIRYANQLKRKGGYKIVQDHPLQRPGAEALLSARPPEGHGERSSGSALP